MNYENLGVGLTIFFIGFFKKLIFADLIAAGYVHPAFDGVFKGRPFGLVACWGGALALYVATIF